MIHITRFDPAKQGPGYLPVHYSDGTMSVYTYHPDCDDSKRAMLIDINKGHSVSLLHNGEWSRRPGKVPSIQRVDCLDQLWTSYAKNPSSGYFVLSEDPKYHLEYRIVCLFNSISVGDTIGASRKVSDG